MEKIRLGRTGMMVSKLGFGGIPIQRCTEDDAVTVVRRCLDHGITFLDTANGYTTSEDRIGKAVAGRRDKVFIATKSGGRTRRDVEAHLKLSLQRLGTDYIDLYQFHGVNDRKNLAMILAPEGPMAVFQEAKAAGKVRHIGITSHQIDTAVKAVASDLFETVMFPFNFITHDAEEKLLPLCRQHDVGFIAMKPLAGGMLDQVKPAFQYLFGFADVVPIPGVQETREIDEIVAVLNAPRRISAADRREMERLRTELGPQFCHRCDYCQPCQTGIPISTVLTGAAFMKRLPEERVFGDFMAKPMQLAADCIGCGECEERCPYHLPIRDLLKERIKSFEAAKKDYERRKAARA